MASLDRPFKDSYGQLDAFQTIAVHSSTQQTMATASHVCYHFLRLFSDIRLPLQIALVQILSFNPPVLLLKPFKQHNKQQYDWTVLCRYIIDNGAQFGWSASVNTVLLLFARTD